MKKTLLSLCVAGALFAGSAQAQLAVFDPANFQQNLLTAARTLEQINNQVRQLQNEAQMLANDARNLTGLDFSALQELRAALADSQRLIDEARGIAFEVSRVDEQFRRLYPERYTAAVSGSEMASDARERWRNSLEALHTATRLQAQAVENFVVDERALADLVARSQGAEGQLQATQATNQLLALQARQAIQGQQLQLAQDRAVALEHARTLAVHEQAREVRRRFRGEGVPYTPTPVRFYGD
ncbi:P-type conjugative transfer protein TrbJ [Pseudoxanthomonas suwonensis]|uniref:Conjugal transfer protein TrbJ n=1 Tax=Pseudoxanthomonas suwonensis TaxID=314722 RepID=A0A0E3Z048_9GAMM|nr:P-type conjugative transfer protein TrbJ [Pseudoxanthomonas suwonensis]AKC86314.1 conjugal transfer protein TrbJ [Pseudoxanthomonas suwonensis]